MKSIILDLDNTILDSPRILWKLYNKYIDDKVPYNENFKWDFEGLFTQEQLPQVFKLFEHPKFYDNEFIEVFPNAIEVINQLSMQYKVIIATKHEKARMNLTQKWVYQTFPTTDIVFLDSFDKSSVAKGLNECICFMDDRLDALSSVEGLVDNRICYREYDWNLEWAGLRINNWLDFKAFIDSLQLLDKNKIK